MQYAVTVISSIYIDVFLIFQKCLNLLTYPLHNATTEMSILIFICHFILVHEVYIMFTGQLVPWVRSYIGHLQVRVQLPVSSIIPCDLTEECRRKKLISTNITVEKKALMCL